MDYPPALQDASGTSLASAAIQLSKLAKILPAIALFPINIAQCDALALQEGLIKLNAGEVIESRSILARTLRRVAEAPVPLTDAAEARLVAFRPDDGGIEHIAILIGNPLPDQPILVVASIRNASPEICWAVCAGDCGEQLRGAIRAISDAGSGVLIYLAQEGRGIGLVNKLRAYRLQDSGFDTIDANHQLGFDADERIYQPAAEILRQLGFDRVSLLTNNPDKVAALKSHGISVIDRVPHSFPANDHNRAYLETKATKSGHLF